MPPIQSLHEYVSVITRLQEHTRRPWYRGIDSGTYSVQPGLYWRTILDEAGLVAEYVSMAPQLVDVEAVPRGTGISAAWQWYFLMQHYGMPTRLLDWTENPLVALYFALRRFGTGDEPPTTPRIWVLDPALLNEQACGAYEIIVPGGAFSQHWLYDDGGEDSLRCRPEKPRRFKYGKRWYRNELPIAIYPIRQNPRIVAQAGVFTIHGSRSDGLERILGSTHDAAEVDSALLAIDIDPASAKQILRDLEILGVSELSVFPELPNLAIHIMRQFEIGRADAGDSGAGTEAPPKTSRRTVKKKAAKKTVRKKKVAKKKAARKKVRRRRTMRKKGR